QYARKIDPLEGPVNEHDRQDESKVADPVDDECFLSSVRRGFPYEPESDKQVRAQADALPSDEHQQVIVRQDQRQHEEDEQVQIREIAIEARVMAHVSGGVHMNEKSNAGHD